MRLMINFSISSFTRLMLNMNVYPNFVQGNDKFQRDLLYPLHSSHKSCGLFFVRAESSLSLVMLLVLGNSGSESSSESLP